MGERTHSLLSPSSAERWLHCTPSARICEKIPYESNEFMEEGTTAHALGEIKLAKTFGIIKEDKFQKRYEEIKQDKYYCDEIETCTDFYVHTVKGLLLAEKPDYIWVEMGILLEDYIPEGHGTADCVMIEGETLYIIDYKHGQGVKVEAPYNEQLMLYALGFYTTLKPLYKISDVCLVICQPRATNISSSWNISINDLLKFGEKVKETASIAWKGLGECKAGKWCQFCRALATCETQAKRVQEVKDKINNDINCISLDELTKLLDVSDEVINYLNAVKKYALNRLLNGEEVKGYKLVEGRSKRMFTDPNETVNCIKRVIALKRYYTLDDFFEHKLLSLTQIEKMLGKKLFKEEFAEVVYTPKGNPTLAKVDDKRPEYNSIENAFKDL